jgi:MFS family permease
MTHIHRTVIVLGFASLLTDLSSEMIYPLLPAFLAGVLGAGPMILGVIEGVAETTAAAGKMVCGAWADRCSRRKPFVLSGYGLAGAARPLIGLALSWPFVLAMRFLDRVGKGLRAAPRDALIADVTAPESRGTAFGFHRAMDHAGAVLGPIVAWALMTYAAWDVRDVFLFAAAPAALVIVVLWKGIREEPRPMPAVTGSMLDLRRLSAESGPGLRQLLVAVFVFTLGNSTDAFLLFRLGDAGVSVALIPLVWAAHHVVKMAFNYYGGKWSDTLGRKVMLTAGWAMYAGIYAAFAFVDDGTALVVVFLVYGMYYGFVEPSEKALMADLAPAHLRGTAFGVFNGVVGLGALPASVLFGVVWAAFGATAAFGLGAVLALAAAGILNAKLRAAR